MIIRAAKASELEEIAELQHRVFRPDEPDSVARYLAYATDDPTYTLDHTRVIEDNGKLVAHLRIWDRTLRIHRADLFAAGIGSLCVDIDCRGRGYAHALMADSEGYFFHAGYDLGVLFTIIGTPFYEAQKWIPIPLPVFDFGVAIGNEMPEGVRILDIASDLPAVQDIYAHGGLVYEGAAVRSEGYWTDGPARIRGVFPTLGAIEDGRLVAYVTVASDSEEAWIKEACALPGKEVAYERLGTAVLSLCAGKKLEGSLPHNHKFVNTLEALSGVSPVWNTHDEMMVKGVNWNALRSKLGDVDVPPTDETSFWAKLLGDDVFYWWTDIFICVLGLIPFLS